MGKKDSYTKAFSPDKGKASTTIACPIRSSYATKTVTYWNSNLTVSDEPVEKVIIYPLLKGTYPSFFGVSGSSNYGLVFAMWTLSKNFREYVFQATKVLDSGVVVGTSDNVTSLTISGASFPYFKAPYELAARLMVPPIYNIAYTGGEIAAQDVFLTSLADLLDQSHADLTYYTVGQQDGSLALTQSVISTMTAQGARNFLYSVYNKVLSFMVASDLESSVTIDAEEMTITVTLSDNFDTYITNLVSATGNTVDYDTMYKNILYLVASNVVDRVSGTSNTTEVVDDDGNVEVEYTTGGNSNEYNDMLSNGGSVTIIGTNSNGTKTTTRSITAVIGPAKYVIPVVGSCVAGNIDQTGTGTSGDRTDEENQLSGGEGTNDGEGELDVEIGTESEEITYDDDDETTQGEVEVTVIPSFKSGLTTSFESCYDIESADPVNGLLFFGALSQRYSPDMASTISKNLGNAGSDGTFNVDRLDTLDYDITESSASTLLSGYAYPTLFDGDEGDSDENGTETFQTNYAEGMYSTNTNITTNLFSSLSATFADSDEVAATDSDDNEYVYFRSFPTSPSYPSGVMPVYAFAKAGTSFIKSWPSDLSSVFSDAKITEDDDGNLEANVSSSFVDIWGRWNKGYLRNFFGSTISSVSDGITAMVKAMFNACQDGYSTIGRGSNDDYASILLGNLRETTETEHPHCEEKCRLIDSKLLDLTNGDDDSVSYLIWIIVGGVLLVGVTALVGYGISKEDKVADAEAEYYKAQTAIINGTSGSKVNGANAVAIEVKGNATNGTLSTSSPNKITLV